MSRSCLALLLIAAVPALAAAQRGSDPPMSVQAGVGRYMPIQVPSCPFADRLLGPLKEDVQGAVRGVYDKERDTSYFVTGVAGKRPNLTSSTKFAGTGPVRNPVIRVTATLRGSEAVQLAEHSRNGPIRAAFVLNDSVTVYPVLNRVGPLEGEPNARTLHASALLEGQDVFKVAAARDIVMRVGLGALQFEHERRELRALIRVVVCPR